MKACVSNLTLSVCAALFVLANSTVSIAASNACRVYIEEPEITRSLRELGIDAESSTWQYLLFESGAKRDKKLAPLYIENITASVVPWAKFFESGALDYLSFENAIREQHRLGMSSDGERAYVGFYYGRQGAQGIAENAGEFRVDYNPDFYPEKFFLRTIPFYLKSSARKYLVRKLRDRKREIPGISEPAQPGFEEDRDGPIFYPPESKYLGEYLAKMHSTYVQLRTCESCDFREFTRLLAEYYYVGANAHMFKRVNQSLLMAKINYLLMRNGFKGINHSITRPYRARIDAYAMILPLDQFTELFIAEVERMNP